MTEASWSPYLHYQESLRSQVFTSPLGLTGSPRSKVFTSPIGLTGVHLALGAERYSPRPKQAHRCSPRQRKSPRPRGSQVFTSPKEVTSPKGLTGVHLAKGSHPAQKAQRFSPRLKIFTSPNVKITLSPWPMDDSQFRHFAKQFVTR